MSRQEDRTQFTEHFGSWKTWRVGPHLYSWSGPHRRWGREWTLGQHNAGSQSKKQCGEGMKYVAPGLVAWVRILLCPLLAIDLGLVAFHLCGLVSPSGA